MGHSQAIEHYYSIIFIKPSGSKKISGIQYFACLLDLISDETKCCLAI